MKTHEKDMAIMEVPVAGSSVEELYEAAFPPVARFISHMGGSFEDARDIFHDALVIFYEKEHTVHTSAQAYLLGIAKHLWIRQHHRDRVFISLDAQEKSISIPADYFPSAETQSLLALLQSAGKKCLDLLRAFYEEKRPVKQIAASLGYTSEHSASVQKYKCLEKLRDTVKSQSVNYEDFLE